MRVGAFVKVSWKLHSGCRVLTLSVSMCVNMQAWLFMHVYSPLLSVEVFHSNASSVSKESLWILYVCVCVLLCLLAFPSPFAQLCSSMKLHANIGYHRLRSCVAPLWHLPLCFSYLLTCHRLGTTPFLPFSPFLSLVNVPATIISSSVHVILAPTL